MKKIRSFIVCAVITILLFMNCRSLVYADQVTDETPKTATSTSVDKEFIQKVDDLVKKTLRKAKVPGASLALVRGDEVIYRTYGYEDREMQEQIGEDTLFELGSMSKAFTGLGILLLEQEGKLSIDDPVKEYIPWLSFSYDGDTNLDNDMTIANLLYHTSGIPFQTIGYIPEGTAEDSLEKTVKMVNGVKLDFYPGEKYQYATVNYDILAYIIQSVTGELYETFMEQEILDKLGLSDTHMYRYDEEVEDRIAQGYKFQFLREVASNPPAYRGNTAAGYIVSSIQDMARWMQIQMGIVEIPEELTQLIMKSHQGNTKVVAEGDKFYGSGWLIDMNGDIIKHGGSNPTFSSMLEMQGKDQFGVCILTNIDSNAAEYIADSIIKIYNGESVAKYKADFYKSSDMFFSIIIIVSIVVILLYAVVLLKALIDIFKKKRIHVKAKDMKLASIFFVIPLLIFTGLCTYNLPKILFERLPWSAVGVWASKTVIWGCILVYIAIVVFMLYISLTFNFTKDGEKNYMALIPISVVNGVASALIIFTINETFNRNLQYSKELLLYFIFSIVVFVYSIKLLQGKMIYITNELIYNKRIQMIEKILQAPYQKIESLGQERIYSGLNNDTSAVSEMPNVVVNLVSNMLTIVFCLLYLTVKSTYAFLASTAIVLLNGLISIITNRIATKYWEKNRDIQETFFGQMRDLVYGFKELCFNCFRKKDFKQEMEQYTRKSADFSKAASLKLLNFNMYNVLMYNLVFGVVVFIFPLLIKGISVNTLRENLFIVFYLIGPFEALATAISKYAQIGVNMKRINKLLEELEQSSVESQEVMERPAIEPDKKLTIQLKDVIYHYIIKDEVKDDRKFMLGPINAEFQTGQITFIIGGNGSGKSTLGKLVSGLYCKEDGEILVNGKSVEQLTLLGCFTAVYSDFHLFQKLYGIPYQERKEEVASYLELLKIEDKVHIKDNGAFESLSLSTGQKKRLAFVISCLDDKPMMIFDEWAAEQDPVFRDYFYMQLLPMLKKKGKGVIVITHDDNYFNTADQIIKLDCGKIVES